MPNQTVLSWLESAGYAADVVQERKGRVTVRIRTSKGWTYERFAAEDVDAVTVWGKAHQPEVNDADAG